MSNFKIFWPGNWGKQRISEVQEFVTVPEFPRARFSLGERKIHSDRGDHGHWFVVQHGGLIAPLLYGVDRRLNQQRVARNDLQVLDRSFLADFSFQNHDTLNARLFRKRWIRRLHLRDQVGCNYVSSDPDALRRWRRWWWRRWRRRRGRFFLGLQNASKDTGQYTPTSTTHNSH